jgi:CarD family transcriptional regulator
MAQEAHGQAQAQKEAQAYALAASKGWALKQLRTPRALWPWTRTDVFMLERSSDTALGWSSGQVPSSHDAIEGGIPVQFSIGDKVVHPYHGPGRITGVERKELLDGQKLYYEIEIPVQALSVHLPGETMQAIGVRPAMSRARLPRVLAKLGGRPRRLPNDFKQRQEEVWERLRTGRVMQMAEVVRDLTWHQKLDHLTKKDTEFLTQGTQRLTAEMALVSGTEVSDMKKAIEDTLAAALSSMAEREQRH